MVKLTKEKNRFLSLLLYALPIIFFIISYFLLTASGEDIHQGAGNLANGASINPLNDAIDAFKFNSRITDMYAWSVIDFFDYQFAFGLDIIFRLVDVVAVSFVFYLTTYLILGRKPKLLIKDALVFCACFVAVAISPFGRTFYVEFSMIHNYVPLALTTLLFAIPYYNLLTKNPPKKRLNLLAIAMLILGVIFGMSATITPLAFLLTLSIYCFFKRKSIKHLPIWFFTGIVGTIIGFLICWLVGSGIDHYTSVGAAMNYDYIGLTDVIKNPTATIPRLLWHEIYNFGITLVPLFVLLIVCLIFAPNRRAFFTRSFYFTLPQNLKSFLLVSTIFLVIHVLGASLIKAPPRLLIPAYLIGIIALFKLFISHLNSKILSIIVLLSTVALLIIHTIFLVKYHQTAATILAEIKSTNATEICIDYSRSNPPRIPVINLSQANIIVDWGYPEMIYDKSVTFCSN